MEELADLLTYQRDCKAFAAELVYLPVNWDQEDPHEVVKTSPQLPAVQALYAKYTRNDPQ